MCTEIKNKHDSTCSTFLTNQKMCYKFADIAQYHSKESVNFKAVSMKSTKLKWIY